MKRAVPCLGDSQTHASYPEIECPLLIAIALSAATISALIRLSSYVLGYLGLKDLLQSLLHYLADKTVYVNEYRLLVLVSKSNIPCGHCSSILCLNLQQTS